MTAAWIVVSSGLPVGKFSHFLQHLQLGIMCAAKPDYYVLFTVCKNKTKQNKVMTNFGIDKYTSVNL